MHKTVLILSDIHGQMITLKSILEKNQKKGINFCFIAGDITNFGTINDLENVLKLITKYIAKTYFVLGNCDPKVDKTFSSPATLLESHFYKLDFFTVLGFGTHKPKIKKAPLKKLRKRQEKVCLITHVPPYGTKADYVSFNRHRGSLEVRNVLEKYSNVFLHISGHIHESPTISKTNNCTIINPGPVTIGNYAIIYIDNHHNVTGKIYNIHDIQEM